MATLRVFCVTSPLWSRRALICRSTRLLCRWNEPWVPCCPTLFPESVPLRPPGGGVPISPAGCQHAHGKRKSCLLPGAPLRLPLIHKPCHSTHLSSSLSVPCQSLYVHTMQVHQKHVLPVPVAQNLPQSLVKVKAPGGSAPHQPQSGMRHSLTFPGFGWMAGGTAPASTPLKATLLWMHITCFPGGIVGLVQLTWWWFTRSRKLLWLYRQEFASVWQGDFTWVQRLAVLPPWNLEKVVTTDHGTAGWNWQGSDCCNWSFCVAEYLYNLIYPWEILQRCIVPRRHAFLSTLNTHGNYMCERKYSSLTSMLY